MGVVMKHTGMLILLILVAVWFCAPARAADPAEKELTLIGAFQCNGLCKDGPAEDHVPVMVAVDGSPAIVAQVKEILDKNWPDKGLDADAAVKIDALFNEQMKYYIDLAGSAPLPAGLDKKYGKKNHYCHASAPVKIVGTVSEKDGKKWIKVAKYDLIGFQGIKYPAKMMMPDQPFVLPDKEPLVLKINDALTLNCIKVPPGRFYAGESCFVATRYIEQFPHLTTLTRPVYVAEIPVTQEIWEAIMGANPSKTKDPRLPVENPAAADVEKFCKLLSEKTGRAVRLPTGAEWEYVARSGTSNPGFPEKYREFGTFKEDSSRILPVKSKKPNVWGFYDLFSGWWEMTSDCEKYPSHKPEVDPHYPLTSGMHMLLGVAGGNWTITEREFEKFSSYTSKKFRIAVEVGDGK